MCFKWHNCYIYSELCVLSQKKKKQHPEGGNTKAGNHFKADIWNSRNLGLPFISAWGITLLQRYKQHSSSKPEDPKIAFPASINGCCLWAKKISALYDLNYNDIVQHKLNINSGYLSKSVLEQSVPHRLQSFFLVLISFKMLKILQYFPCVRIPHKKLL